MMVNYEPKAALNSRYTIEEAAELLGIHHNTLLRYVKQGLLRCGFRRNNRRKFFLGSEIIRFWKAQL